VNEDFTLVDGSLEAALGKIDAGSSVQHSYVVVPNKGSFGLRFDPATVTYVAEIDSSEKQVRHVLQKPAVHSNTQHAAHTDVLPTCSSETSVCAARTLVGAIPYPSYTCMRSNSLCRLLPVSL
jgi:aspartate aminotransferase-like enzyme